MRESFYAPEQLETLRQRRKALGGSMIVEKGQADRVQLLPS
jgi:hypothetical protein